MPKHHDMQTFLHAKICNHCLGFVAFQLLVYSQFQARFGFERHLSFAAEQRRL
jgi:hypothetical protein